MLPTQTCQISTNKIFREKVNFISYKIYHQNSTIEKKNEEESHIIKLIKQVFKLKVYYISFLIKLKQKTIKIKQILKRI